MKYLTAIPGRLLTAAIAAGVLAAGAYAAGDGAPRDHALTVQHQGPTIQWALVRGKDAKFLEQSGGIHAVRSALGNYFVTFPSDTRRKAIQVTPQWQNGNDLDLTANVVRCGGTHDVGAEVHCVQRPNNTREIYVETWAQSGSSAQPPAETNVSFYISVVG